jgi:hypothetical protein
VKQLCNTVGKKEICQSLLLRYTTMLGRKNLRKEKK